MSIFVRVCEDLWLQLQIVIASDFLYRFIDNEGILTGLRLTGP